MRAHVFAAVTAAVLLGIPACGGGDPERNLEEASRDLAAAREGVEQARAEVAEREADVEAAEQKLAAARSTLREAEAELSAMEQRVDLNATDSVLFRTVQKRLLEDDDLSDVAIAARVESGVVTLSGSVPEAALRDRAVEIAREAPGVSSVKSLIEVARPEPARE